MLFRLVKGAARIIQIRRFRLLDMRAKYVSNGAIHHEVRQALGARRISGDFRLRHIEPAGVQAVARHQIAGEAIIERDARVIVARNWHDIDDAAPEIDLADIRGPSDDSGGFLKLGRRRRDELHARHSLKLLVTGGVIAVAMRMDHDQRDRRVIFLLRPFGEQIHDERRRLYLARPGVLEQGFILTEDQIQKRLFGVYAAGLAQDVEVVVVGVDLPVWHGKTVRTARLEGSGQCAGLETRAVRLRGTGQTRKQQGSSKNLNSHMVPFFSDPRRAARSRRTCSRRGPETLL